MYAVIKTGGKQYRVSEGETLRVEKLPASAGDKLTFETLLFADDGGNVTVGRPLVNGVKVEAEVLALRVAAVAGAALTFFMSHGPTLPP
jgi:large subunit ribosomal protein L21